MYFIIFVCWRRRRVESKKKRGKEKNRKTLKKIEKNRKEKNKTWNNVKEVRKKKGEKKQCEREMIFKKEGKFCPSMYSAYVCYVNTCSLFCFM